MVTWDNGPRESANRRHPRLDRLRRHPGPGADRPEPRPVPGARASSAGGDNVGLLAQQALEFEVEVVAVAKATVAQDLQLAFYAEAQRRGYAQGEFRIPKILTGPDASTELAGDAV